MYAHTLGESIVRDERLRLHELREVARRELAIVAASLPLIGALLLGTIGLLSPPAAYWLAFALGLVVLGVEGIRFARIERMGALATLAVVAANLGFGVLLIALKLLVSH